MCGLAVWTGREVWTAGIRDDGGRERGLDESDKEKEGVGYRRVQEKHRRRRDFFVLVSSRSVADGQGEARQR